MTVTYRSSFASADGLRYAAEAEQLPRPDPRGVAVNGVIDLAATADRGEEVTVDRLDGDPVPDGYQVELLPVQDHRGVRVDDVGDPATATDGGEEVPTAGPDPDVAVAGVLEEERLPPAGEVALVWMTSVVRPPAPTAVRKFPVLFVWMTHVDGTGTGKGSVAEAGWLTATTPAAASTSPPATLSTRLKFMRIFQITTRLPPGALAHQGVPSRSRTADVPTVRRDSFRVPPRSVLAWMR